eukprot:6156174-Amphidinium_carterae.1
MDTKQVLQDILAKDMTKAQEHEKLPPHVRNIKTTLYYDPKADIPASADNVPRGELQQIAARLLMK